MADVQVKTVLSADVRPYVSAMQQAAAATTAVGQAAKVQTTSVQQAARAHTATGKAAEDAGNKAKKAGEQAASASEKAGDAAERSGIKWAALGVGITIVGAKIAGALQESIAAASNLSESTSKMERVFGSGSAAVKEWAGTVGGMSKRAAYDAASMMALFGKSAGLAGDELQKFSTDMVDLSVDLGSFFNSSPEEAIEAIGSALRGETESIRKYNVLIDAATLQQRALKMGLIDTTKEALTPQQRVLAAQAEILAQTSDAQGDYTRTAAGLANSQRDMAAAAENAKAALGEALLPAVAAGTGIMTDLLHVFNALPAPIRDGVAWIGLLLAAVTLLGPALTAVYSGLSKAVTGLVAFRNSAIVANAAAVGFNGTLLALRLTLITVWAALGPLGLALGALAVVGAGAFAGWAIATKLETERVEHLTEKLREAAEAGKDLGEALKFDYGMTGEQRTVDSVEDLVNTLKGEQTEKERRRSLTPGRGDSLGPEGGFGKDVFLTGRVKERFEALDKVLAGLDPAKAAGYFNQIAAAAAAAGIPLQDIVDLMPEYTASLNATDAASALAAASSLAAADAATQHAEAVQEATSALWGYIDAQLGLADAQAATLGMGDMFAAAIRGPASSAATASRAEKAAVDDTADAIRKKDKADEEAEVNAARRRAERRATQSNVKGAIDTDKAARAGKDIDGFKQGGTVTLTPKQQDDLDKEIEGIRKKHQKATDAKIKGLKEESKAAGATGQVYADMSTTLEGHSTAALRNQEAIRRGIGLISAEAQKAEEAALAQGESAEEAAKIGVETFQRLYEQLLDTAEQTGYNRSEVEEYIESLKLIPADIQTKINVIAKLVIEKEVKEETSLETSKRSSTAQARKGEKYQGFAVGGEVGGPAGTDRVPLWATRGEFIVNAPQYAANRDLVRAINASTGKVRTGMSIGTVNVTEATSTRVRVDVIDALAEAAYRHGAVR